jgi:hypothetical protein
MFSASSVTPRCSQRPFMCTPNDNVLDAAAQYYSENGG